MKQIEKISRNDWIELGAFAKLAYLSILDLDTRVSGYIGKSHDVSTHVHRLSKQILDIKNKLDELIYEYGNDLFSDQEIGTVIFGPYTEKQKGLLMKYLKGGLAYR